MYKPTLDDLICPVCRLMGSNPTCEGPQVCYACDGKGYVLIYKFIELLRRDVTPSERVDVVAQALENQTMRMRQRTNDT